MHYCKKWLSAAGAIVAIALMSTSSSLQAQTNPFGGSQVRVTTSSTETSGGRSVVSINGSWVNVRSGPGTNNSILKTLPQGSVGYVVAEKNGWNQVVFGNGLKGWVRADLLSDGSGVSAVPATGADKSAVEKSFARWDRQLSKTSLDFSKVPSYYKLGRAWSAYQKGDWQKAFELAQDDSSNPLRAKYLMAKSLYKLGKYAEAKAQLSKIERALEDEAFTQVIDTATKPYIDEPVIFKFGGFDDVAAYRKKKANGNRIGLDSSEYYEDFVDISTWKWKSNEAYKEFQTIAGIDCSGFVQRVQMDAYKQAGVTWPIQGRTSAGGLSSSSCSKEVNPGYRPPPPPDARPGDMILFDYGHNRYGHSAIYRGTDVNGNIHVVMMGDVPYNCILPAEKIQYYKGTYRMKGMDEVRKKLTA